MELVKSGAMYNEYYRGRGENGVSRAEILGTVCGPDGRLVPLAYSEGWINYVNVWTAENWVCLGRLAGLVE